MQRSRTQGTALLHALAMLAAVCSMLATAASGRTDTEESAAYRVEVSDVTARVGEPQVMLVTLRVREGYRILKGYNNRVIRLSSLDDGVAFDRKVVPASLQDDALVFAVGLRATKPGKHPINGIFRVGYIRGDSELAMVSIRLIATVTGTE
jgi:hypothetical protein